MKTYLLIEGTDDPIYLESGAGIHTHPEPGQLIKINTLVDNIEKNNATPYKASDDEYSVEWFRVTRITWEIYNGEDMDTEMHCHLFITKIDTRFGAPPQS